MASGIYGIRETKILEKCEFLARFISMGDILSGYISPKLHREFKRTERSRKRRLL